MARGDPVFARTDVKLPTEPKIRRLKHPAYKWLYQTLYLASVESRSERLPDDFNANQPEMVADRAQIHIRTVRVGLQKCAEVGFIGIDETGAITVYGVRENHPKLEWRERVASTPSTPHIGPITDVQEQSIRENKTAEQQDSTAPAGGRGGGPVDGKADQPGEAVLPLLLGFFDQRTAERLLAEHGPERIVLAVQVLRDRRKGKGIDNEAAYLRTLIENGPVPRRAACAPP
jgi:hypothetical protein